MAQLAFGRFRPVLDFGQQRRLDPDAAVCDLFGVGLRLPDQRFEPRLQILGRRFVEAVVDLAGLNQILSLVPPDIEAVETVLFECETRVR
jgi:hypothetical protein